MLELVAADKSSKYKGLVDAQDEDGETALGIVARLGNASMVRMLLDVGARKDLPNALGIRPSDWGIESGGAETHDGASVAASTVSSLPPLTAADLASHNPADVISALTRPAQMPVMKSSDVRDQLSSTLDDLQATFARELGEKNDALATVQSHLQAATRDLAARRKTVGAAQAKLAERDEARQRAQNLRRAIIAQLAIDDADAEARLAELQHEAEAASAAKEADAMDVDGDVVGLVESLASSIVAATDEVEGDAEVEELVRLRWVVSFLSQSSDSWRRISASWNRRQRPKRRSANKSWRSAPTLRRTRWRVCSTSCSPPWRATDPTSTRKGSHVYGQGRRARAR